MARIITTIGASATAGLTAAEALAIAQASEGYEYIKFVPVSGTVSYIDILSLDTTTYTAFKIICSNLNLGGSGGQTVYFYMGYNNTVHSSGSNYYNSWFSMLTTTSSITYAGNASAVSGWTANYFGEGGSTYSWNPSFDLQFTPSKSSMDVQMWGTVNSLQVYYNGNIAGSHMATGGTNPNMFRIYPSNTITGTTANNSGVYVLGIRKRTS